MRIHVDLNERVIIHVNGKPEHYLAPGRHRFFHPLSKVEVNRFDTDEIIAHLRPEQLALVPAEDLRIVTLKSSERALVTRKGRVVNWLGVGEHQIWMVDRRKVTSEHGTDADRQNVQIQIFDTSGIEAPKLREEVQYFVPPTDYVETTAPANTVALRFVDGALEAALPAGRHAAWTTERKVTFTIIDLRERLLHVTGQEVMTKDRVTLRLNLSADFKVVNAERVATVAREPDEILYLAIQFAAREAVATRTLDQLLSDRDAIGGAISPIVAERADQVGLEVISFGVKDVVLPGEMKTLLNRVIEAQKEAEANVILRREETAAVRSMANTAKVLDENPTLLRLKELEAYKEMASKIGQVHIVVGEGKIPSFNLLTS